MAKENYKEKVEELRQEIELEDAAIKRSRSSRHGKAKTKKQKNPLMKLLVFIFILIPLGILFYVWFLFEPDAPNEVVSEPDDKGIVVEIQNQPSANTEDKTPIENEEKSASDNQAAEDEAAKQVAAAEEAKKAEAAEIKKAEEAQAAAAAKLEEQKRLAAEQAAAKKAEQVAQASTAKSHTVLSTDNLYRIALKHYGNGSAEYVNKIKQANGLTSDSISAGQVLIIP